MLGKWGFGVLIVIIVVVWGLSLFWKQSLTPFQNGGYISPRAGPVDLLQMPKSLYMNGYRFQDALLPPSSEAVEQVEHRWGRDLCQIPPRVGIFKASAYTDEISSPPQQGGDGASVATLAQLHGRDSQDQYLSGQQGDPIEVMPQPFGLYQGYPRPEPAQPVYQLSQMSQYERDGIII
jgi:hypothetical protein